MTRFLANFMDWLAELARVGVLWARNLFLSLAEHLFGWKRPVPLIGNGETTHWRGDLYRIRSIAFSKGSIGFWAVPL